MFIYLKHKIIKKIEKIPLLQIFIYNHLSYFKFLFPHDKDYYALNLLFTHKEKRAFIDVGGNIGVSTIGFRELGFSKNRIFIFEPDKTLVNLYLKKIIKKYKNLRIYSFGLSEKNESKLLYRAFYKDKFFHFNNSFDKNYIRKKLSENYGKNSKNFKIKSTKLLVKRYDNLNIKEKICFIKIDVEGFDHLVLYGMKQTINKFNPVILIEYNLSNFEKIFNFLKKKYDCFFYDFEKNVLNKLSIKKINQLKRGKIIENLYKKNSVNIFFIPKNKNIDN